MGQFSVKIYASPGSSLSANQHLNCSISEHRTLQNELKEVESAQKVRQPFFAHSWKFYQLFQYLMVKKSTVSGSNSTDGTFEDQLSKRGRTV
jgi:hypothetical protein